MADNNETHRHETFLTPEEWTEYKEMCKEFGEGRKPKAQTRHLIQKWMKKCKDQKK